MSSPGQGLLSAQGGTPGQVVMTPTGPMAWLPPQAVPPVLGIPQGASLLPYPPESHMGFPVMSYPMRSPHTSPLSVRKLWHETQSTTIVCRTNFAENSPYGENCGALQPWWCNTPPVFEDSKYLDGICSVTLSASDMTFLKFAFSRVPASRHDSARLPQVSLSMSVDLE